MANLLSTLHSSAKTAVPTGAGLLISVPSAGGRAFDELAPSALAGLGFNLRGVWAANTVYAVNDVVTYQGSSYAAPTAFTSSTSFNSSNWTLIASKGDTGATGAAGSGTTVTPVIIDGTTIVASTSTPYQMQAADRAVVLNKTTGAASKVLLPTNPALGVDYKIKDGKGDASANNITVTLTSGTIDGQSTFLMNSSFDGLTVFASNPTTWWIS